MSYLKKHYHEAKEWHENEALELRELIQPILNKFNNEEKLNHLKSILREKENNTLVLGAGVSIAAGIPDWKKLVNKLVSDMLNKRYVANTPAASQSGKEMIYQWIMSEAEGPLAKVRYVRLHYSDSTFYKEVHNNIFAEGYNPNTPLLNEIAKLVGSFFQRVITYNFDDLLEQALENNNRPFVSVARETIEDTENTYIYHVHGLLTHNQTDFSKYYVAAEPPFRRNVIHCSEK